MSAATVSNPASQIESKSAKKKKAKAEAPATPSGIAPTSPGAEAGPGQSGNDAGTNGHEGSYESPYIKELYK